MATSNYAHGHDPNMSYASNDPPIDPVLQLHRSYDEQQQLSSLSADHAGADYGQGHYPPPPPLDGPGPGPVPGPVPGPSNQSHDRDGFRPHQDPRPIIPPNVDTSVVDLTYRRNPRTHSANNPGPDGWLYPHKKGIGTGSNLEAFKDEIEARTMRGENCKAISAALNAMGVQTSDKAISRVRIKWGMRKRSQRKIKTPPPDSEAARLTAKTKVQTLRKIEIRRMTQEGMTAEQIYENLTSRGMELKKGVATVLRLQSAWKLTTNPKRWLENFRHQCHKRAKAQQVQAFKDIAKEMALDDFDAWLEAKLAEEQVREARHELAIKLMGEHAPTINRRKLQARRGEAQASNDAVNDDDGNDDDDEEDGDEQEVWQEAVSNPDPDDNVNAGASSMTGLDGHSSATFEPMDSQTDPALMADDGNSNSTADVAMRAFAQTLSTLPAASNPAPSKPRQSGRPVASNSLAVTTPASKRGRGRASKAKQSNAKSTPKSTSATKHEAPTAQMTPDESGAMQGVETTPQHQDTQLPFGSMTASPAPALILRPEEAEANRSTLSTLDQYRAAAEAYQEVLQARTDNRPLSGSLTGLPPSSKEVDAAKRKLKDVTQAMMLNLD